MEPYEDETAHLIDELKRIDCLLRRYLETWRPSAGNEAAAPGLYVSDAEVDHILSEDGTAHVSERREQERHVAMRRKIDERVAATLQTGRDLRLWTLTHRFGLTPRHVDALLLSVAPELDLDYEKVYAYLQDDLTRKRPTVGLITRVLRSTERGRLEARHLLSEASPLVTSRLVRLRPPEPEAPLLSHLVAADQRIVEFLLGCDGLDSAIAGFTEAVVPETAIEELPLDADIRADAAGFALEPDATPVLRYVYGPYGIGKNAVVEAMCNGRQRPLVRADAAQLRATDEQDGLDRLIREARLREAALHLTNVHRLGDGDTAADTLARDLCRFTGHVFLTGETEWRPPRDIDTHAVATLHLPRPGYQRRKELWDRRAGDLPTDLDTADLAATFSLTEGQIDDAIAAARQHNGFGLTSEAVYNGCRTQSRKTLGSFARRAEPTYTWEDIVLPADEMQQLREVAAHVTHRGTVYADWGFADRFSLGNGLNVLFSGPSGTGKTMAAEIIAGDAGLDLFKIDLANVVSKYIGETETHLKEIFDEAEHSDAILFFDEADALFGERSEVRDSHDRYANIEVSYLLQRIEEHDGTVILASNFKENIDDAFLRRINLSLTFPRPDYDSRYAIWVNIFPEETPIDELDYGFLSSFEITGGNIKNVALTAAFLAADDGVVEMTHVVRALRRELQKTGRLVNPEEFGEYERLVG